MELTNRETLAALDAHHPWGSVPAGLHRWLARALEPTSRVGDRAGVAGTYGPATLGRVKNGCEEWQRLRR